MCDGEKADLDIQLAIMIPTWYDGEVSWSDTKRPDIRGHLVTERGLWGELSDGCSRYTSIGMMTNGGCLATYTSSAWSGHSAIRNLIPQYQMQRKLAFPICKLGTKPRNDPYGNIDPVFQIVGWAPRSDFDAILGPQPQAPALSLKAPEPAPAQPAVTFHTRRKPKVPPPDMPAADIIDDQIPF
jgi:hypothetical protein